MKFWTTLLLFVTVLTVSAQVTTVPSSSHWRAYTTADGLPQNACISVTIGSSGKIFVRHPRATAISRLDGYSTMTIPAPGTNYHRVYESPGGQLWLVSSEGLQEFREGSWTLHRVPEIAEQFRAGLTNISLCPVRLGQVLVLLKDKLMRFDADEPDKSQIVLLHRVEQTRLEHFTDMKLARDGGLWISGERGVAKVAGPVRSLNADSGWRELIPPSELEVQNFQAVREGPAGNWTAVASSTSSRKSLLVRYEQERWGFQQLDVEGVRFAWRSLGRTWAVTADALMAFSDEHPGATINEDISARHIFDVAVEPQGAFWLATSDGLFRNAAAIWKSKLIPDESLPTQTNREATSLLKLSLPEHIARLDEWRTHLITRNGDLWLAGANDMAWRHQDAWQIFSSTNRLGPQDVVAFAESPNGRVWCGADRAVWEFRSKNWLVLISGLGRVHGLCGARDGTLWVATDSGVQRLTQDVWIPNGPEDGLPSANIRSVFETPDGQISVATAGGSSVFHPELDPNPPKTFLRSDLNQDLSFHEGNPVTITFSGRDKWKFTTANRLLFSYRLDERDWSPFREVQLASFADLPLGRHFFQVRAMDRAGNIEPEPARLEFTVVLPWYRETRLLLVLSLAVVISLSFAAIAMNRHRLLRRSYAVVEEQIAARTKELEIANRELLHGQKMNALGTLAAGIAHDFNNILSIVKGSAQIIEDNLENPNKIRTRTDRIKSVVEQGAGIVQAMLGFSRSSEEQPGPCNINSVVDDTITLLGDRFLREIQLSFSRTPDLPVVSAAKDFVQQILLNFLFNAAESMADRKRILIKTALSTRLPEDLVLKPGGATEYISISVQDFGCGILPENLPRIFEPFFTTKALSSRRGTGLGLSMVYELARRMNAGLSVESAVGRGSTFTLILPVPETSTASNLPAGMADSLPAP